MNLKSKIIEISGLTIQNKKDMYGLMTKVYYGENWDKFLSDMSQKDYALVLYNESSNIVGFTTIEIFDFEGKIIIYSGDTVIDENFRGDIELMRAWWRFSYTVQMKYHDKKVLWLLISKGWRTYKFFPMFLKEIYPTYKYDTPKEIQDFIDRLSVSKFGNCYKNGLVIPNEPDRLKSGENDIPEKRAGDYDVKFFLEKNPEFYKGNELVCLAQLSVSNLTNAGLRLLHGKKGQNEE